MTERDFLSRKIEDMLLRFGVVSNVLGFEYLIDAVAIMCQDHKNMKQLIKIVFESVAERHQTTAANIDRCIRNCIIISTNNGVFKRIPEFRSQVGNQQPTNKTTITIFSQILKKEIESNSYNQKNIRQSSFNVGDDLALHRAAWIKPLVRVDNNGEVCMPWSKDVASLKSEAKLFYAKPYDLKGQLGTSDNYLLEASTERAKLKYLTTIHTYHEPSEQLSDNFSASIIGVLKQIPDELVGKVKAFELYDDNIGNNQLVYRPEFGKVMKFVGTRLYGVEKETDVPNEIVAQPIIYGDKSVKPKDIDKFLGYLIQSEQ